MVPGRAYLILLESMETLKAIPFHAYCLLCFSLKVRSNICSISFSLLCKELSDLSLVMRTLTQ